MAQWIEVKVRQEKMTETGKTVKVKEPYLVDALSCTEAEARVVEEITPYTSEFNVLNVSKTKISEIFWNESGDRFYKVKVNFITLDEKTAAEKRTASYILVQASTFDEALKSFHEGMKGTMADYEIETISETKIVEVYRYQAKIEETKKETPLTDAIDKAIEEVSKDKRVQCAVKSFRDSIPDDTKVSMSLHTAEGLVVPETVVADKTKQRSDDD